MTNEIKLAKFLKAIKELLKTQDDNTRVISTSAVRFNDKYGMPSYFFRVLAELNIITIEEIGYKSRKYTAKMYANQIQPKHAKDAIDVGNKILASYANKPKTVDNSVVAKIALFNKFIESKNLESNKLKIYRNKHNHSDTFNTVEEAIERNLYLRDYEIHYYVISPKEEALKMISNNKTVTSLTLKEARKFVKNLEMLNKHQPKDGAVIKNGVVKKKVKNTFDADLNKLGAKLSYYAEKQNHLKTAELRLERIQLYIDHNKVPGRNFKDLALYHSTIAGK